MNDRILNIRKYGKTARGQKELLKHLSGQKLTFKQAIYARCYDCMNFYSDGKVDCNIPACPLHPFMAYNANKEKQTDKQKPVQNAQIRAAMP